MSERLLDRIESPADVRALSHAEVSQLCAELRDEIVQRVAKTGGHLASSLGAVELITALHHVFDTPTDRLVLDVGHQGYAHKMLTGRAEGFDRLRKKGSVGGFPSPDESPYDLFAVGHAGTAISTAVGMARGDEHLKRENYVVALVGDASIVNGMAFEGLNNAGTLRWRTAGRRRALLLARRRLSAAARIRLEPHVVDR